MNSEGIPIVLSSYISTGTKIFVNIPKAFENIQQVAQAQQDLDWKWKISADNGYRVEENGKKLLEFNFDKMGGYGDETGYVDTVLETGEYYWTFKVKDMMCCFNAGVVDLSQ